MNLKTLAARLEALESRAATVAADCLFHDLEKGPVQVSGLQAFIAANLCIAFCLAAGAGLSMTLARWPIASAPRQYRSGVDQKS